MNFTKVARCPLMISYKTQPKPHTSPVSEIEFPWGFQGDRVSPHGLTNNGYITNQLWFMTDPWDERYICLHEWFILRDQCR